MPRFVITDPIPSPPNEIPDGFELVAPTSEIDSRFGRPARSLYHLAKDSLKSSGFGVATPITAASMLMRAVQKSVFAVDASSVARHYRESVASILRSGLDTATLAKFGSERSRSAAAICDQYRNLLATLRLVDRDAVLSESVRYQVIKPRPVVIYGYFRARQLPARPEEVELIDRLAADGSVFYLPCGDEPLFSSNRAWLDLLIERGWQTDSERTPADRPPKSIQVLAGNFKSGKLFDPREFENVEAIEYPDQVHEVRSTLARAKASVIQGVPLDQVVIVCRDLSFYARPLIAAAHEYNIPVRLDHEIPIAETELGQFISLILEAIDRRTTQEAASDTARSRRGFLYEPTIRLMLHRLGPGLGDEQRALAYRNLPSNYDAWRSITNDAEVVYVNGKRSRAEWTSWLRNSIGRWEVRSKEKLGSSAEEMLAYDRLFRALEENARDNGMEPIHVSQFAADVADVLVNVSTPLHTARGGIRIAEPNDLSGCSFDTIFVVGMTEGSLPAISADSSVIDLFECERLREYGIHFQDALEVPRWEALSFYFTLLTCRRRIVFSFPKFAADREQIASSYFKRLGLTASSDDGKYISSNVEFRQAFLSDPSRQNGDAVFTTAVRQLQIEKRRESDAPADEYDGVIGIPIERSSWSATSLTKFGSCRFRWFASDLLKLREPAEAGTDLPANTRGTLLHKTLELAVARSLAEPNLRQAVLDVLETAFSEAESLEGSLTLISNWNLRRVEQIEKLRIAVSSKEFVADRATVLEVEKEFRAELCGLTIKGTIDRIDRLGDESVMAVDYKHGLHIGKIKDENGYLKVEIQLPLYCLAALPTLYPGHTNAGGQFFHLADPKITKVKETDLIGFLESVRHALETGNFAVDPDLRLEACEYCEYDVVCRVGPRIARKRV